MLLLRRRAFGSLAFAIGLLTGTTSAGPADPLPQAIRSLEAEGNLAEARTQVRAITSSLNETDLKEHLGLLEKTANLLGVVDAYVSNGLTKQAIDALTGFLSNVSQPREAGLAIAVQRRLAQLQSPGSADTARQAAVEQAARDALTRADTYFARALYQKAKDAYETVAKQTDPLSDDTKARAKRGVAKASQKLFEDEPYGVLPTLYRSLSDAAQTIWQWALSFLVVLALITILRHVWLTSERSLELVDLVVQPPSPSANRELTQELQDVIDRIRSAGPGSAKLDATGAGDSSNDDQSSELPPPDLVFVTPPVDAPELTRDLDAFVSSTPTIQFGGFGLNPQQLWSFIKRVATPRARHAFTGTLTTYDNTLTLRLTREDRLLGTKTEWRAFAPSASTEARITCLVDVAARLVLDRQDMSTVTSDCHSLKEYILGLYALSATGTPNSLNTASAHFQAALDRDEANWLARFQLALCARGRKDIRTAVKHLTWFTGPEANTNTSLQNHIERHKDFPYVVKYQLASTLSIASEDHDDERIEAILNGLIELDANDQGKTLEAPARLRLVMLARSGQSTREAVQTSLLRRDDDSAAQKRTDARERLRAHRDWFNQHADELQHAAPTGHPLARGVVLHAYGRLQFSSGDRSGAIGSLSEAVDLMPTYADVHVDLAKAWLERKEKDWPQRVTTLLDRALALDPGNTKAMFVYARFYFAEETRNYAKAEPYLTAAPFDATSLFMLAQVLNNRGSYAETLDVLERAIALQKEGPPFRVRMYADALLERVKIAADQTIVAELRPNPRALERARRQLCEYDKLFKGDARTTKNYLRIGELYREICTKLNVAPGTCFQATPIPPPPPAAPEPQAAAPAQQPRPASEPTGGGEPALT